MFNLHFVGRGAAFNPVQGNTNAWFIRKTHLVLLDCGENAFAMVHDFPGLLGWDSITVLITHLHADHAGSLATLCSYCYFVLRQKVLVVHPLSSVTQLLSMQGVDKGVYNYVASLPSGFGFEAKAVPVNHVIDMKCFAYELRDSDETIYYSGDSADFPVSVAEKIIDGTYSKVFHDIASYDSPTHCPVSEAEKMVPPEYRNRVYAMHLDSDFEGALHAKGFSVAQISGTRHSDCG